MGRIKTLQTDASMFSTKRYRKLIEENNNNNNNINNQVNNNNSNLIRMKLSQDYIAYCCGQCGHHQKFDVQVNYSLKKKKKSIYLFIISHYIYIRQFLNFFDGTFQTVRIENSGRSPTPIRRLTSRWIATFNHKSQRVNQQKKMQLRDIR